LCIAPWLVARPANEYRCCEGAIRLWRKAPDTQETLVALPDVFHEVIVLREIDDLSYREIAATVSAPAGTLMSRLHADAHCCARPALAAR
jgi:DNA-directed RNA polymerase specialized sigma24 family protein